MRAIQSQSLSMNKIQTIWQKGGIKTSEEYKLYQSKIHEKANSQLEISPKKRLLAIYDTADFPFTYDVTTFLMSAELKRIALGLEKIDFLIISQAEDPSAMREAHRITPANYKNLSYNLLIECSRLFSSIGSVISFDNRHMLSKFLVSMNETYQVFPDHYDVNCPIAHEINKAPDYYPINFDKYKELAATMTAPQNCLDLVQKFILQKIYSKIPITITLREWKDLAHGKNSNIDEWQKLVEYYASVRPDIVFIVLRDFYEIYTDSTLVGDNVIECNEAVVQLSYRAALYQEASLNLLVNNGCSAVALFNKRCRYLIFNMQTESNTNANENLLAQTCGLLRGDQFPGATMYQQIIYEADKFEIMKFHLDRMLELMEYKQKLLPSFYDNI